ncbi:MAG: hypothetical protein ACREIA_06445 [Opitutaceae bacterium]
MRVADRPRLRRVNLVCAEPMPGEADWLRQFVDEQFAGDPAREACRHFMERVFEHMQLAGEAGSLLKIEEDITAILEETKRRWTLRRPTQLALGELAGPPPATQGELAFDLPGAGDEEFWKHAETRVYEALAAYARRVEEATGHSRRLFADDARQGFAFIDLCRQRYDVALLELQMAFGSYEVGVVQRAPAPSSLSGSLSVIALAVVAEKAARSAHDETSHLFGRCIDAGASSIEAACRREAAERSASDGRLAELQTRAETAALEAYSLSPEDLPQREAKASTTDEEEDEAEVDASPLPEQILSYDCSVRKTVQFSLRTHLGKSPCSHSNRKFLAGWSARSRMPCSHPRCSSTSAPARPSTSHCTG